MFKAPLDNGPAIQIPFEGIPGLFSFLFRQMHKSVIFLKLMLAHFQTLGQIDADSTTPSVNQQLRDATGK